MYLRAISAYRPAERSRSAGGSNSVAVFTSEARARRSIFNRLLIVLFVRTRIKMPCGALCAVDGCKSSKRRDKHLTFFHLPVNEERRKTWAELIGRPDLARPEIKPKSHYVCCLHFEKSVIIHIPQLRPDALPTKLLPSLPTTLSASTDPKCKEISTQTQ